jgi:hypothetical protein
VNYKKFFFVGLLSILILGCVMKPPVSSDYDTNYDFSQLKTYSWITSNNVDIVSTLDNKRQKNAIETMLNRKGFSKIDDNTKADFLLKTHSVTDKKVNIDRFHQTWGYHPFYHPNVLGPHFSHWPNNSSTIVREYKIGTLVLDIVDPNKKQVIWRGSFSKPLGIYLNKTPEERATIALSDAELMLANFPPQNITPN